jgi:hypothetical protein
MSALNWIWYTAGGLLVGWIIMALFDWSWFRRRRKPAQDPYSLVPTEPPGGKSGPGRDHEESAPHPPAEPDSPKQRDGEPETSVSSTSDGENADAA